MTNTTKKIASLLVALILVAFSCVTVFAEEVPSPTGVESIKISILSSAEGGSATYEFKSDYNAGPKGGTLVKFTSKANDGYTFSEWQFTGDYTVYSGSLNDPTLEIEAFSDITATPMFTKNPEETTTPGSEETTAPGSNETTATAATVEGTSAVVSVNSGKTSPQTGSNTYVTIAMFAVLAAAAGVIVVKRRMNSK